MQLKAQEAKLRAFTHETQRSLDSSRVQTLGFGRSTSQRAVWAARESPAKIAFDAKHIAKTEADKLTNYKQAVIPPEKLSGYALNKEHSVGKDKAVAFEKYLGYTVDNQDELIAQVRRGLNRYAAKARPETQHGQPYQVLMMLKGPNGQYAKVKTGWIVDKGATIPRLISIYVKE